MLEDRQPRSLRACSRDDPECGARRGVLRRRLVTVRPGRPGKSPARHYDLAARSSLNGSKPAEASATAGAGDASAAPGEKPPRVERRETSARVMGRKAPRKRLACRVMCRPNGCSAEHPNVSRRSAQFFSKPLKGLENFRGPLAYPRLLPGWQRRCFLDFRPL